MARRLSCPAACGILVPRPGIEPASPALKGGFFTTGPPGKFLLYYFKKGTNATEMQKKICAVYGEGAVTDRMCQKWFAKFRAGDFSLDNAPRSSRPVEVDGDQIET